MALQKMNYRITSNWLKFLLLLTCLIITNGYAALDLELTQGVSSALPIAVVPFNGQLNDVPTVDEANVASIISHDLASSGRFKVLTASALQQFPHQLKEVNFLYWQQQKQNNLVVGIVKPLANGQVQVNFSLIDIYANNKTSVGDASASAELLNQQFIIPKTKLRALAHHISDLIYQQLIGDRGVFSTKIAYMLLQPTVKNNQTAKYILEIADIDGYNPQALLASSQPIMSPSWSPDGQSIAYVSFEKTQPAIYIQNIATGQRRLITDYPGINGAPAWSPDGHQLAVVLTKTGYPKIFVVNLTSGNLTQVTEGTSIDTEPRWALDGQSLIFTSSRGGGPQIYQISLSNHQVQRLTFTNNYNASASFTPDGKNLVFLTQDSKGFDVAMQDLANGRFTLLTQAGQAQSPSIAPNGKMIVYALHPAAKGILAMVSTDSSVKLELPAPEGSVREPAWSPFLDQKN